MVYSQDLNINSLEDTTVSSPITWRDYVVALALWMGSLLPRLIYLVNIPAVVFDEVCYTDLAKSILNGNLGTTVYWGASCTDRYYPLWSGYAALLAVVYQLFGLDVFQTRLFTVLGYGLAIGLLYLLALRLKLSRKVALASCLIFATDFVMVSRAIIVRPDTYVACLGLLALLLATLGIERQSKKRWLILFLAGLMTGVAVWLHTLSVISFLCVIAFILYSHAQNLRSKSRELKAAVRDSLVSSLGFGMGVLPFIALIMMSPTIFLEQFAFINQGAASSLTLWQRFLNQFSLIYQNYRFEPLIIIAAAWAIVQLLRKSDSPYWSKFKVVGWLLLVTAVGLFFVSSREYHRFIMSPFIALLAGGTVISLFEMVRRRSGARLIKTAAVVFVVVLGLNQLVVGGIGRELIYTLYPDETRDTTEFNDALRPWIENNSNVFGPWYVWYPVAQKNSRLYAPDGDIAKSDLRLASFDYVLVDRSVDDLEQLARMHDELRTAGAAKLTEIGGPARPQPLRYSFNYWIEVWRIPPNPEQAKISQLANCQDPVLSRWPSAIR